MNTDDNERTPDESEAAPEAAPTEESEAAPAPAADAATGASAGESDPQSARAASTSDAAPDSDEEPAPEPVSETEPEAEPVSETEPEAEPVSETEPEAEPVSETEPEAEPVSETEPEGSDAEVARAQSPAPAEESEGAAATSAAEPSGDALSAAEQSGEATEDEEYEPTPREKPEIPGADLEPVFVAQEDQYLDAEAQAAAEAEAEAAAERARAEVEDEQARPIADAAIDLAAGARYTATGKRKTAVARVVLKPGGGEYSVNGKSLEAFFPRDTLQRMIRQPLEAVGYEARMDVVARMHGGGVSAQAGALRHGISRALIEADPNLRGELKRRGYLTRDPRVKERKKAGLKKARKRPQFSKR